MCPGCWLGMPSPVVKLSCNNIAGLFWLAKVKLVVRRLVSLQLLGMTVALTDWHDAFSVHKRFLEGA